ncbi:FtsX-like permease family protein [Embleya sp. NPDC127516]|uniref:FtsX-like permease family protein n=1 Tax=Embleya sp. NPDC127516 TaxID=3363990 RepID=UPI00381CBBD1
MRTTAMPALAYAGMRARPMTFAGVAAAVFLTIASVTLFGTLVATPAPPAPDGRAGLALLGGAFGEIAVVAAVFVVATTLGYATRQQQRELVLLRAAGATPRQVRRLVRLQIAAVVAVVGPPAWATGAYGARWFVDALAAHGLAAHGIDVPAAPVPMAVASAVAVLVGAVVVPIATRGATSGRPVAPAPARSLFRLAAGVVVLATGGWFCMFLRGRSPDEAGQGALLAALILLLGVALLGPFLVHAAAAVPLRPYAPRVGRLVAANLRGHARRVSAAVVPVALLTGLACTFRFVSDTIDHTSRLDAGSALAGVASPGDVWLRQAELVLLACFGAVATVNSSAALTLERRREFALLRLIGAPRALVARMLAVETALTAAVGIAAGTAVAWAAAAAFGATLPGAPLPTIDMGAYTIVVAGALGMTGAGVAGAAVRALADPAVSAAAEGTESDG